MNLGLSVKSFLTETGRTQTYLSQKQALTLKGLPYIGGSLDRAGAGTPIPTSTAT